MKIQSAVFETSAPDLSLCPPNGKPEFAFIGRSNVGKSSLINLLTGRNDLAKVSEVPGKTQLINFFVVNNTWRLVDLPGYGYAKVGQETRAKFNEAVAEFIAGRRFLRCVFVLIDSRLPPQPIDLEFLKWIDGCKAPIALIFTKTDKQSASQTRARVEVFVKELQKGQSELPAMFVSSAKDRTGKSEILAHIASHLQNRPAVESAPD